MKSTRNKLFLVSIFVLVFLTLITKLIVPYISLSSAVQKRKQEALAFYTQEKTRLQGIVNGVASTNEVAPLRYGDSTTYDKAVMLPNGNLSVYFDLGG